MGRLMGKPFDLLLGRETYEIFAAHWPFRDLAGRVLAPLAARKYVATTTQSRPTGTTPPCCVVTSFRRSPP